MGWKSTIQLTRNQAIEAVMSRLLNATNNELENILTDLEFGDNTKLPYFGYNFRVMDEYADINKDLPYVMDKYLEPEDEC
jgi:hypothetical protein